MKEVKDKCDYCNQPGVETDCTGSTCCAECWEYMKNWIPEQQVELENLSN